MSRYLDQIADLLTGLYAPTAGRILVDGVPVIGRLDGNIDLSQINLENVDHIEIVEGPMSVIYGSNALAGVVNFILDTDFEGVRGGAQYSFYNHNNDNDFAQQLNDAGCTILYTTHYMEEAQRLCDRVGIIDHGRLLALDTVEDELPGFFDLEVDVLHDRTGDVLGGFARWTRAGRHVEREGPWGQAPPGAARIGLSITGRAAGFLARSSGLRYVVVTARKGGP